MDKRKVYGTIFGIIIYAVFVVSMTYSFYVWRSDETDVTINISDSYFYCESGIEESASGLQPVLDYKDGSVYSFKVNNVGNSADSSSFSISMKIKENDTVSNLFKESFKYVIMADTTGGNNDCTNSSNCTEIATGNFKNFKVGMNTLVETVSIPNDSRYEYYLFIYIDGNMSNDTAMQSSTLEFTLDVCEVVAFLDYNGGNVISEFVKITGDTYGETTPSIPTSVTKSTNTIKYNTNGGNTINDTTITHTFNGWYKDEGTWANKVESTTQVNTTLNHTLYAKWTPSVSSVTYPTPTRAGYKFDGWYTDEGLTQSAGSSYVVSNDTTGGTTVNLYAKWVANKIYIKYSVNDGIVQSNSIDENNNTYTWTVDNNGIISRSINGSAASQIFQKVNYGETLGTNGLNDYNNTKYLNITRTGYVAADDEWICLSGDCTLGTTYDQTAVYEASDFCDASDGDCTVVLGVNWKKQYTTTFKYYNNATITKTCALNGTDTNCDVALPTDVGTPSSYTFRGWSTSDAANAIVSISSTETDASISADITYYASYETSVTGTFYYSTLAYTDNVYSGHEGTTTTATATRYLSYKNTYIESNFTIPSEVTSSSGGGTAQNYIGVSTSRNSVTTTTPTTENTTYYAVYTENLKFHYYNGTSNTTKTVVRRMLYNDGAYSNSLSETAPTPSAYDGASYSHWTYNSAYTTDTYKRTPLATGVSDLYAVYKKTLTLSYDANGGTNAPSSQTGTKYYVSANSSIITTNPTITISSTEPTHTGGYNFERWVQVPSGYQQVDYIQTNGTQYINTNFIPNNNTRIILDYQNTGTFGALYGARKATSTAVFGMWIDNTTAYPHYGNTNYDITPITVTTSNRNIYDMNKNLILVNGIQTISTATTFDSGYALTLFGMNQSGSVDSRMASGKLYSAQIYDNGTLVRNLIPCYRTSDNVVGMYDTVNNVFFINSGTGSFTYGSVVSYVASDSITIATNTTLYAQWVANKVKITINKDGSTWSASGMKVTLYNGTTATTYTATVSSGSQATLSAVPNGTYNIYAGKNSLSKTTLLDSGVDVTVNNNSPSAVTVNYYTLTMEKGTGISNVSNAGQTSVLAVQHLYNASSPQTIAIDATVTSGYTWSTWSKTSGTNLTTFTAATKSQSIKMGAGASVYKANATDSTAPGTPTITRSDYNTFTYIATDGVGVTGYYVSTSSTKPTAGSPGSTFALNTWTTITSTGNLTLSAGTYYVWARDAAGNVSGTAGTIKAYTISRSQGTGTTLTTRYDSTTSSTGTAFTSNTVVLHGTPIWASASANTGYKDATLKHGSTSMTASGGTFNASATETIASSATLNTYTVTININKGGSAWSSSGMNVALYSGTTVAYAYSSGTVSGSTVTFSNVESGTYNVYATISNGALTTLGDTGIDITASTTASATINYYTISRNQGTGTTLTTRYDSTSEDTGTAFTTGTKVLLSGTNVWAKTTENTGYSNPILKRNGTQVTNPSYVSLTSDLTIASSATELPTYTVTLTKGTGIASVSGAGTYASGTTVTIDATVSANYAWSNWTGSSTQTTKSYSFTITSDVSFTANAVVANYSIKNSSGTVTGYAVTLANAISAASAGDTITLLRNYTDSSSATFNKNLTFNTGGYTLTRAARINVNSGITVTKNGTGTITSSEYAFVTSGKLILSAGTITATGTNHTIYTSGSTGRVQVSGATVNNNCTSGSCYSIRNASTYKSTGTDSDTVTNVGTNSCRGSGDCAVYISSGTVGGTNLGIYSDTVADIAIKGGTVNPTGGYSIYHSGTGTIFIAGGIVGTTSADVQVLRNASTGDIEMTAGTIKCAYASGTCTRNNTTGVISFYGGTVTASGNAIYNAGTGTVYVGLSGYTITVSSSCTDCTTLYCGSNSGSNAICRVNSGATITATTGRAVSNYNGDFRQYSGSTIKCTSDGNLACVYNRGTTYTTSGDLKYGMFHIRQGYIQSKDVAIKSDVKHANGVYIGQNEDSLYNLTDYSAVDYAVTPATGPMVRSSTSYGITITTTSYKWRYLNGMVGGDKDVGITNVAPSIGRSGHTTSTYTGSTYKYYYLKAS